MKDRFVDLASEYGLVLYLPGSKHRFYSVSLPNKNADIVSKVVDKLCGFELCIWSSLNRGSLYLPIEEMRRLSEEVVRQIVILLAMECAGL